MLATIYKWSGKRDLEPDDSHEDFCHVPAVWASRILSREMLQLFINKSKNARKTKEGSSTLVNKVDTRNNSTKKTAEENASVATGRLKLGKFKGATSNRRGDEDCHAQPVSSRSRPPRKMNTATRGMVEHCSLPSVIEYNITLRRLRYKTGQARK